MQDLSPKEKLVLIGEAIGFKQQYESEKSKENPNLRDLLRISNYLITIQKKLGKQQVSEQKTPTDLSQKTDIYYSQDEKRTKGQRQKQNDSALALLKELNDSGRKPTPEEKSILAKFSGYGGNLKYIDDDGVSRFGSKYEYYTPAPLAAGVWDLLKDIGFSGGKILDPSSGSGVFAATRPVGTVIDQVELSKVSGGINSLVNDSDTCSTKISPFEAIAASTPDEIYDAVVTNVPFASDLSARGSNNKLDKKWQNETIETYFILRSLDKLKANGLAAFIVPPRIVSDKDDKSKKLRTNICLRSEFLGAYRLPNSIFDKASSADTIVDVIVMRKFSKDAKQKIDELNEQDVNTLIQSNVLWQDFIDGKYFVTEGRKFVLGEFQAKDPNKIRDVDRVISDQSTANIAKLLKKFPDSRIDWDMLNVAETAPIVYQDGQVIYQDGQSLRYENGAFVAFDSQDRGDDEYLDMAVKVNTAINAVCNALTFEKASEFFSFMNTIGKSVDIPIWLRELIVQINKHVPENNMHDQFAICLAGLAIYECYDINGSNEPFNYSESYAELNDAIKQASKIKIKTSLPKEIKDRAKLVKSVYDKNTFSDRWLGTGNKSVASENMDAVQTYDSLVYSGNSNEFGFVEIGKIKEVLGSDIDVLNDDDWCIDATGSNVIKADDYYTGSYAEFLKNIESDIANASSEDVRLKILKQRELAKSKVDFPDVTRLKFTMSSPFISAQQKLLFLRENVHPRFYTEMGDDGKVKFRFDKKSDRTEMEWTYGRYADFLNRGSLNTRTSAENIAEDPELEAERLSRLRELRNSIDTRLNIWVKTDNRAFSEIKENLEDPKRIFFKRIEDTAPINIDGWNDLPLDQGGVPLHSYQNAELRNQTKKFGGIIGFGTGLGKTFTALATVQYIQSIGIKKKTVFVVPNNVLTNWRREAMRGYKNMEDCLFVGLDVKKDGKLTVDSKNYRRDMEVILQNRHKKIFMTLNAFTAIPIRDETISAYSDFISGNDPTYAVKLDENGGVKQADIDKNDAKKGKIVSFGDKDESYPFFEDMGIDSIVMDEAHMAKNSKFVVDFKSAAYLSTPLASNRGLDVQLKSWYIRGLSKRGDGVLCLSATPITNSPLEIYSMLSIAIGEKELNDRLGIFGADQFMDAFSAIEYSDEEDIIGNVRNVRTFTGIQNVNLLRTALKQIANIKDAEDVGNDIAVPEAEESITTVQLDKNNIKLLSDYKRAYAIAKIITKNNGIVFPEELEWYEEFKERENVQNDKLLAHPFNIISKMTDVILDDEIDSGFSRYHFNAGQLDKVTKAVKAFNDKGYKDEVINLGKTYTQDDVIQQKKKTVEISDGNFTETIINVVKIRAKIDKNTIVLNSVNFEKQSRLIEILEKNKIDIDVNVSPKLASMIANFKLEQANPKSGVTSKQAKQIIFCDSLSAHNKIRILLNKQCGIPLSKISIVNAVAAPDAADMQDIQDGFNGEDDENKYTVIIANKKAEVGINLQNYTQAIHHLTIGWTPDSLTQRNGRAVRQGNKLGIVKIYHYNTDGTFDDYKRMLVNKKDAWITNVMKGESDIVTIDGGMSNQDMEDMLNATGDKDAIKKINDRITAKENNARIKNTRLSQTENARIVETQQKWLDKYPNVNVFKNEKNEQLRLLKTEKDNIQKKLSGATKESIIRKLQGMLDDTTSKYNELESYIGRSAPRYNVESGSEMELDYLAQKKSVEDSIKYAKAEFDRQAKESKGAYSSSILDSVSSGNAVILNGKIISEGMIGISNGKFYVAGSKSNSSTGYAKKIALIDPSNGSINGIERGANFDWYCESDATWPIVAENVAAIDDATINEREDISHKSDNLFSTFNSDVASRVKAVMKTNSKPLRQISLKAPYFEYVVSPLIENPTVLQKYIIDNQSNVLYFNDEKDYAKTNGLFDNGYANSNKEEKFSSLAIFSKSKGLPITLEDVNTFVLVDGYSNYNEDYLFAGLDSAYPEAKNGFIPLLNDVVKNAKTPEEIDTAVFDYFNNVFSGIFTTKESFNNYLAVNGFDDAINSAKLSLSVGGRPILLADILIKSNAVKNVVIDYVVSLAEKNIDKIGDLAFGNLADFLKNYNDDILSDSDIEGFYQVNPELSSAMIAAYELEKPVGAFVISEKGKGDSTVIFGSIVLNPYGRNALAELKEKVKEYKLAQSQTSGGFDIEAVKALDGVKSVEIGDVDVAATLWNEKANKYNASYRFMPNTYVAISLDYNSNLNQKMMDKNKGLKGRFFDNGKQGRGSKKWFFTINKEEQSSVGSKMASVADLIEFSNKI